MIDMHRIVRQIWVFAFISLLGCGMDSKVDARQVMKWTKESDLVLLCDVDTSSGVVKYRLSRVVLTRLSANPFNAGELLPYSGGNVEPNSEYGQRSMVFLSRNSAGRLIVMSVLAFHDERPDITGIPIEEAIRAVECAK